jgi:transcriptional regulator GlxA family with amidase domain
MQAWKARCVQAYIGVHLHAAISIDNLAEVARTSADGLMEAFRAYFRCTPQGYILRKRVERAMSLMMSSDDPLGQISVECGFENQRQLEQSLHEYEY